VTFVLKLDEQDLAVIAAGLGELPLKVAKATFDKINQQVAEQPPQQLAGHDMAAGCTD
jgi:hypothetical protein